MEDQEYNTNTMVHAMNPEPHHTYLWCGIGIVFDMLHKE